ncbi:hypothetical protein [Comamonas sp. GB3 AK4-5]|uniref:hypothetical protein n=1 Tax=Comamonas sp. GB3 AK4-5 TaxID=3231487 RepID=UPI00351F0312
MQRAHVLAIYFHLLETVLRKLIRETVEEGTCLIWQGAVDAGSPVMAMPYRRFGQGVAPCQLRVRGLLLELCTNKRPPANAKPRTVVVSATCRNGACVCPDCARYVRRTYLTARAMEEMNPVLNALRKDRILAARKESGVRALTDEQALRVKTETGTSARALARELGVNFSVVQLCRKNRTYRELSPEPRVPTASPWAGLAS